MNTMQFVIDESGLMEALPQALILALKGLPERMLFRSDHADVMLAGLRQGQELTQFEPPMPLLMRIGGGRVLVRNAEGCSKLEEGQECLLDCKAPCELRALEDCALLFFASTRQKPARQHATDELLSDCDQTASSQKRRNRLVATE